CKLSAFPERSCTKQTASGIYLQTLRVCYLYRDTGCISLYQSAGQIVYHSAGGRQFQPDSTLGTQKFQRRIYLRTGDPVRGSAQFDQFCECSPHATIGRRFSRNSIGLQHGNRSGLSSQSTVNMSGNTGSDSNVHDWCVFYVLQQTCI